MRKYKEYYIAVLDLLGFKSLLNTYDCFKLFGGTKCLNNQQQ